LCDLLKFSLTSTLWKFASQKQMVPLKSQVNVLNLNDEMKILDLLKGDKCLVEGEQL
jgi:hypothetical protein